MKEKIHLTIVGPEDILYYGLVTGVTLPTKDCTVTVWAGHPPQMIILVKGAVGYIAQDTYDEIPIEGGFADVSPDKISIVIR